MFKPIVMTSLLATLLLASCSAEKNAETANAFNFDNAGLVMERTKFITDLHKNCAQNADCAVPFVCLHNKCDIPPSTTNTVSEDTSHLTIHNPDGSSSVFHLEVVKNDRDRALGMMRRKKMHPDWGMLFVFESDSLRSFWMHNCYISLDMVFIRENGTITNIAEKAIPMLDEIHYRSTDAARYVLELPGGTAAKRGITTDSTVTFDLR